MNYIELNMKLMNNFYHLKMIFNYDIRKHLKSHNLSSLFYFLIVSIEIQFSSRPTNRQINESRIFIARNSVLTDLFETSHIRSIRNVFIAVLLIFVIQVTINDIIQSGR
jgi:sterol O-acyltransferase